MRLQLWHITVLAVLVAILVGLVWLGLRIVREWRRGRDEGSSHR